MTYIDEWYNLILSSINERNVSRVKMLDLGGWQENVGKEVNYETSYDWLQLYDYNITSNGMTTH